MSIPVLIPKCELTRVGLKIRDDTSFDDWLEIADKLYPTLEGIQWCVGDHLNFGNNSFSVAYSDRMKAFGSRLEALNLNKKQLYNYAYVSNKVSISVRKENLSWTHHSVVTALAPEKQDEFLTKAEANKWTVKQLKEALKLGGMAEGASEQNTTQPEFSPLAWMNESIREFTNACDDEPITEWKDERILTVWECLIGVAKTVGGPIKSEIERRGLEVAA